MSGILSVRWTVTPITAPEPILLCAGCGCKRAFRTSSKFRLNANGKQIDACLIYNCTRCSTTWNRPIFQRIGVRNIDPATLYALQSNDRQYADEIAFDLPQLRRHAHTVREAANVRVRKQVLSIEPPSWSRLEIVLSVPIPTSVRTDRLLAHELKISRARVQSLVRFKQLRASAPGRRLLRRPIRDEMRVFLELERANDRLSIGLAAAQLQDNALLRPD